MILPLVSADYEVKENISVYVKQGMEAGEQDNPTNNLGPKVIQDL